MGFKACAYSSSIGTRPSSEGAASNCEGALGCMLLAGHPAFGDCDGRGTGEIVRELSGKESCPKLVKEELIAIARIMENFLITTFPNWICELLRL